jgi:tripartite-type tricarboxylate transporter receptor subunit TctC
MAATEGVSMANPFVAATIQSPTQAERSQPPRGAGYPPFLGAFLCAAVFASTTLTGAAHAQDWPRAKPVTLIVAHGAGSATDSVARIVGNELTKALGAPVVIENKPGAGGNIASQFVKRAAPDGYTVLVNSVSFAVNPTLYKNAGYTFDDFAPVAHGPQTPNIITVPAASPIKDIAGLIAAAKTGKVNYGSSGVGTTTHLSMERLKAFAKVDMQHVPFLPAQAITAVVGAQVDVASTSMPPAVPQVKAGKLRALAVTSAERSPLMPEVPSLTELGYKQFDDHTWFGFFAPKGTPDALVQRLNAEINRIVVVPEVRERFAALGLASKRGNVAEFGAFVKAEGEKWGKVVRDGNLQAE